jgi:phosphatidylglycerophosphate synthase
MADSAAREPFVTAPNALSLARVPLAAAVWIAPASPRLLLPLVAIAALTDLLDGWLARVLRRRLVRQGKDPGHMAGPGGIGAWLDPVCDKVFVLSVLAAVYWTVRPSPAIAALILAREVLIVPLALVWRAVPGLRRRLAVDFRAGPAGKVATVAQFAAVLALVVAPALVWPLAVVAAVTGVAAVAQYLVRTLGAARSGPPGRAGGAPGRPGLDRRVGVG